MGHTEINAWGERVRQSGYGQIAVFVEPRIPCLKAGSVKWTHQADMLASRAEMKEEKLDEKI